MKLLTIPQIREWDAYTIAHEPVSSLELMERAGRACAEHILKLYPSDVSFLICCGQGNNGGDGLVIARLLAAYGYSPTVAVFRHMQQASEGFQANLQRLSEFRAVPVREIGEGDAFPEIAAGAVLVDALLGSGITRPLSGWLASVVEWMNGARADIISIDIPSGLPGDIGQWDGQAFRTVVQARKTLTFQVPKTSFLFPGPGKYCGDFHILDIGLHPDFLKDRDSSLHYLDESTVRKLLRPRLKFDHKGRFGHSLLVAGSRGKNGAAVLAARACLRAGTGLLTVAVPQDSYQILQTAVPEAMVLPDNADFYPVFSFSAAKYSAVGVGAGIGTEPKTREGFKRFLQGLQQALLVDADGINLLAEMLKEDSAFRIPAGAVLTPHLKEFSRLAGESDDCPQRFRLLRDFAKKHEVYVLLKGAHSCLATPEGSCYFNSTGNPAMAKGGSGDVLTGMITGLLAQGYSPLEAALLGMYFHGKAGDDAASRRGESSVIASDIIEEIRIGHDK